MDGEEGVKVVNLIEIGYHLTWRVRKKENLLIIPTSFLVVREATVREIQQELYKISLLLFFLLSLFTSSGKEKKKIYLFIIK